MSNSSEILKKSFSTTDKAYSFSRSNRFSKSPNKSTGFYNLPELMNKRSTSFGFGKRSEFINNTPAPPPGYYNPVESRDKGRRISLSNLGARLKVTESDVPGPGMYSVQATAEGPSFSFKPRIKDKEPECICSGSYNPNFTLVESSSFNKIGFGYGKKSEIAKKTITPGPGSYSVPVIFPNIKASIVHRFNRSSKVKKIL